MRSNTSLASHEKSSQNQLHSPKFSRSKVVSMKSSVSFGNLKAMKSHFKPDSQNATSKRNAQNMDHYYGVHNGSSALL